LFQRVAVFARTSPSEKERVVTALRAAGAVTLMAGDGSNDTMALKNAHVGVALLSGNGDKKKKEARPKETPSERQLREAMEDSEPKLVKMGDASIAAPFSTRSTSIECTLRVCSMY
jgi:cation-transporting ATPase 13A1